METEMASKTTFVKVYDDLPDHPGFIAVDAEGLGLWLQALMYCHRNSTDGHFPMRAIDRWGASRNTDAPDSLIREGRWHTATHACQDCPEVAPGYAYVHGYLEVHKSKEQIAELSVIRSKAGQIGGQARSQKQGAKQNAGTVKQTSSESKLEVEVEVEKAGPRKRATQLPSDFTPNDTNRKIAEERGLDLAAVVAQWSDFHRAKGSTFKDWHAALNTWLRREQPAMFPNRQAETTGPRRTLAQCPDANRGECVKAHPWEDARNLYHCQGA